MRTALLAMAFVAVTATAFAQTSGHLLYIEPTDDGFEVYLTAAMTKKKVPVSVTTNPDLATYRLKAAAIDVEKVTTGKKLVNCLFAYCAGSEDKASTSVQLTDSAGTVAWSYSVNKGRGAKNRQSMAESIAEHLKDDYLKKQR
jgi:hypothetical protein